MFANAKNSPAALLLASFAASVAGSPETTRAPELAAASSTRVTTSFYSLVTTQIPRDERSIGMGLQREGTDEYCTLTSPSSPAVLSNFVRTDIYIIPDWLYCINDPFTTKSGFAGCGGDDLYTACSGRVATGIDGGEILWYATISLLPPLLW